MQADGIPFGSYRLLKRIARGGMAEVFLARQRGPEGFDRLVALKRILPHLVDSGDFVRMFLDEARLAARLTHPNVAHIYEFGKVGDHYFIAMEYVAGTHAGKIIQHGRRERVPPELVARIGADAAAGLHYAHALRDADDAPLRIVHRDVSPPNLLVSFDGITKLVDFGIAKAAMVNGQTRPGVVKGKFAYMSPEQCAGKALDAKSDVFSLGIVLWELARGKVMISRDDPVAGMHQIRDGKIQKLCEATSGVPPKLAYIIDQALHANPADRISAQQLSGELESYLKAAPRLATPAQLGAWMRDRFPRTSTSSRQEAVVASPHTVQATASSVIVEQPGTQVATASEVVAAVNTQGGAWPDGPALATKLMRAPSTGEPPSLGAPPTGPAPAALPTGLVFPAPGTDDDGRDDDVATRLHASTEHTIVEPTPVHRRPSTGTTGIISVHAPDEQEPRRSRVGLVATVAALVVAAGIVGLGLLGDEPPAAPRAVVAARSGPPPGAVAPSAATIPPTERIRTQRLSPRDALPPDTVDHADGGRAVEATTAVVEILTRPAGAAVTLDGESTDLSTPVRFDELAPGEHTVTLTLDGHEPLERTVEVRPGERRTIDVQLAQTAAPPPAATSRVKRKPRRRSGRRATSREPARDQRKAPGLLTARTTPWSDVYLGNRKLGTTPFANIKLPAGTHVLTFRNPDRPPHKRKVVVRPGQTTKLKFGLP